MFWVQQRWRQFFPEFEQVRGQAYEIGPFNRSAAINNAVHSSAGDILIIADLDVAFTEGPVREAVAAVEQDDQVWGFAFTDYIKLTEVYTDWLTHEEAWSDLDQLSVASYEHSTSTQSGLVVISRRLFESIGGFDEIFIGWGYEDLAFTMRADELSPHRRWEGDAFHLWHEPADQRGMLRNKLYFEEVYLGQFKPEPASLPAGIADEAFPEIQLTAKNRVAPLWTATGLPRGIHLTTDGMIYGIPERHESTMATITATDVEGITVERAYDMKVHPAKRRRGANPVGVYCYWDESFEDLMTRLRWMTPGLHEDNCYKSLRFVPIDEAHEHALIFNASKVKLHCQHHNAFVLIFEPPEIIGDDNPWLTRDHPQSRANIFMFSLGTVHKPAIGLHLPQATLSDPSVRPSTKQIPCSMICSDRTQTPYHRRRLEIRDALLASDLPIHFYGRGMTLDDADPRIHGEIHGKLKDEALRPYVFTIDFENSHRGVLTDKFIDPLLNGSVPITNSTGAALVFPTGSFEYVNFDSSTDGIVEQIGQIITQQDVTKYDHPVAKAKALLSRGELNICEWLHRKIDRGI